MNLFATESIRIYCKTVWLFPCIVLLNNPTVIAQSEEKSQEKEYVFSTFLEGRIVNAQTVEMPIKKELKFKIIHRFGVIDEDVVRNFFGFDAIANIRFSLHYGFTDKLEVGLGRTKFGKAYDLNAKYLLLKQTKNNSNPVSIAAYFNTAINTQEFSNIQDGTTFSEGSPFENRFVHRLSYNSQIIVGRRFSERLSLQLAPIFIYENLITDSERDHGTFVVTGSGTYRFSRTGSFLFEYSLIATNKTDDIINPLSLGVQFGTAGHAFQLVISSSQQILEQQLYTSNTIDYKDGNFVIGFNIKRSWWF